MTSKVHVPPLNGWKANPTSRGDFDYALYGLGGDYGTLKPHQIDLLLDTYEKVQIESDMARLRVLVKLEK